MTAAREFVDTNVPVHGYSMYDSLIIASALEAGCTTLDLQDGQVIDGLTIRNPFR